MINKIMRASWMGILYASFATIAAQLICVGFIFGTGQLDRNKMFRMLAVAQDVEIDDFLPEMAPNRSDVPVNQEMPSYDDIVKARVASGMEFTLQQASIDNGISDLLNMETDVRTQLERYQALVDSFKLHLAELKENTTQSSIVEVQQMIEDMKPPHAKDQLLRTIKENNMKEVVTLLKTMSPEKRKKIVAEFKTEEENEILNEILDMIRGGKPEMDVIEDAEKSLEDYNTPNSSEI